MQNLESGLVSRLLASLGEGVEFECGSNEIGVRTINNLILAYRFILEEGINKDFNDKEAFYINELVNSGNIRHLSPNELQNISGLYRTVESRMTGLKNPLSPSFIVPSMGELFYLTSDDSDLSPIEKAAICQGGVFTIQPYNDGNKRTGRIMSDKVLLRAGLNIPKYKNREEYIQILSEVYSNLRENIKEGKGISNLSNYDPIIKKIKELN